MSSVPSGGISNISLAIFSGGWGSVAKYNHGVLFLQFYFYMSRCLPGRLFSDRYVINKSLGVRQPLQGHMKDPVCKHPRSSPPPKRFSK